MMNRGDKHAQPSSYHQLSIKRVRPLDEKSLGSQKNFKTSERAQSHLVKNSPNKTEIKVSQDRRHTLTQRMQSLKFEQPSQNNTQQQNQKIASDKEPQHLTSRRSSYKQQHLASHRSNKKPKIGSLLSTDFRQYENILTSSRHKQSAMDEFDVYGIAVSSYERSKI